MSVPGSIVSHSPSAEKHHHGSPSVVVLGRGTYLVSHAFGTRATLDPITYLSRSSDGGGSWERIAEIHGQTWSELFLHRGGLYLVGTDHADRGGGRLNGRMIIRRSTDEGVTWTDPQDSEQGLLSDEEGYHTAPTPLVIAGERLWKAFEYAPGPDRRTWRAFVMSAPVDGDLLDRKVWRFSSQAESWPDYQWIEGNMVVAPDGEVLDILRAGNIAKHERYLEGEDSAAILHVSADGRRVTHDPDQDRVDFPGGGTKFTIRRDADTGRYLSLVNPQNRPDVWRNLLALSVSEDLRNWRVVKELLFHPDRFRHAFQYVDWDFDGDDIVYASRTAYDDEYGGAEDAHDANYITFHRLAAFREFLKP